MFYVDKRDVFPLLRLLPPSKFFRFSSKETKHRSAPATRLAIFEKTEAGRSSDCRLYVIRECLRTVANHLLLSDCGAVLASSRAIVSVLKRIRWSRARQLERKSNVKDTKEEDEHKGFIFKDLKAKVPMIFRHLSQGNVDASRLHA